MKTVLELCLQGITDPEEIAEKTGYAVNTIRDTILRLKKRGLLVHPSIPILLNVIKRLEYSKKWVPESRIEEVESLINELYRAVELIGKTSMGSQRYRHALRLKQLILSLYEGYDPALRRTVRNWLGFYGCKKLENGWISHSVTSKYLTIEIENEGIRYKVKWDDVENVVKRGIIPLFFQIQAPRKKGEGKS